ncbi:class I adenylate-forming enzyme family protein [Aequoribacter sp.]|uniref:class I adenylate-forming enzyme family protein n=1 Tax=Aequoribacter sp. TaxID=2847771 RepID=UPI003F6A0EF7
MNHDAFYIDWVETQARMQPNKTAFIEYHSRRKFTWLKFHERVSQLAAALNQRGIERGDRVAYLGLNSTDTIEILCATQRIGAVYVPLNFRLTPDELSYIIGDAEPKLLICDHAFAPVALAVQEQLPWLATITTQCDGTASGYESLFSDKRLNQTVGLDGDTYAMIMYSSGTTGRPKGVIYTHRMMQAGALNIQQTSHIDAHSTFYNVMPLFHIGGMQSVLLCLYTGRPMVLARAFEPGEMLACINDDALAITHLGAVPAIWNALAAHPDCDATNFTRIASASTGAESVPPALLDTWMQKGIVLREVYGLTETSGIICITRAEDLPEKLGYTSPPLKYCDFKVMRSEQKEADSGELGEIWMRGAMVTPGYWRRDDATEDAFYDGWFRSGDIGRLDPDGCLAIEDRIKDMYISGGENVYPAEVEAALYELACIAEVAVIGVPDDRWGEVGCAVVVLKAGESLTLDTLQEHCAPRLAKYKWPKQLKFLDALPRNSTGKVQKFILRQEHRR